MKRHHNTLYVTTQGAYVAAEGENLVVRVESETRFRVPIHMLEGLVCFGRVSLSPGAMQLCTEHGVGASFLSERGRFIARIQGPISGNVLLRRAQYRAASPPSWRRLSCLPRWPTRGPPSYAACAIIPPPMEGPRWTAPAQL